MKVRASDGSESAVSFSKIASSLITAAIIALVGAVLGMGLLQYRIARAEDTVAAIERRQKVDEQNIRTIDRELRETQQTATHNGLKLDKLLEIGGVTERIAEPKLPDSELREVPE